MCKLCIIENNYYCQCDSWWCENFACEDFFYLWYRT